MSYKTSGIVTGRGATAIFLALNNLERKGKVLVPANLCYAAIYPIICAGMEPVFCDVDSFSGNMTKSLVEQYWQNGIEAVICPHMYGNPIKDLDEIVNFCHEHDAVVIEDCASAMGATSEKYQLGEMGDYIIYSTGHSKIIDVGIGGILASKKNSLEEIEKVEKQLPMKPANFEDETSFFSKLYRFLRNNGNCTAIEKMIYENMANSCKQLFVFQISDDEKDRIGKSLDCLDNVVLSRRNGWNQYNSLINNGIISKYSFENGAVPWRFNFFISSKYRQKFIQKCLEAYIPISDWYPNVMPMFGKYECFSGVDKHQKTILNLPLPMEYSQIYEISLKINKICEEIAK